MANTYPPVAFHFGVWLGLPKGSDDIDGRFSKVSGLSVTIQTKELKEGGQNLFTYKLPDRPSYPNLVLERGLAASSRLMEWAREAMEQFRFTPVTVTVKLLERNDRPISTWNLAQAWPVSWKLSDLSADSNTACFETLELCYSHISYIET